MNIKLPDELDSEVAAIIKNAGHPTVRRRLALYVANVSTSKLSVSSINAEVSTIRASARKVLDRLEEVSEGYDLEGLLREFARIGNVSMRAVALRLLAHAYNHQKYLSDLSPEYFFPELDQIIDYCDAVEKKLDSLGPPDYSDQIIDILSDVNHPSIVGKNLVECFLEEKDRLVNAFQFSGGKVFDPAAESEQQYYRPVLEVMAGRSDVIVNDEVAEYVDEALNPTQTKLIGFSKIPEAIRSAVKTRQMTLVDTIRIQLPETLSLRFEDEPEDTLLKGIKKGSTRPDSEKPRVFVPYLLAFCLHQLCYLDGGASRDLRIPWEHDRDQIQRAYIVHDRMLKHILSEDFYYHSEDTPEEGKYEHPGEPFTWGNFQQALHELDLDDLYD